MTSYLRSVTKDITFLVMAFDGHHSDLSTGLRYQYILPKPCRNVEDRKILMDIKNVLPLDDHPKTVSCAASLSKSSSLYEHEATNDQRSSQQSEYDVFRYKLSKEEDKGFLLFIITHGRQLATRMPHLSEMGALKTFKMLWSKMTPEHKSWYYNNENIIQNASNGVRDIPAHTHQDVSVTSPCSDTINSNFPNIVKHSATKHYNQRKEQRKISYIKSPDHLERRYQTYGKVYQIPRPVKSRSTVAGNLPGARKVLGDQGNHANGLVDKYTANDDHIQECEKAVNGIIKELGDQPHTGLTTYDELKLLPSFDTNMVIKEEKNLVNDDGEMQNEYMYSENSKHQRDELTTDELPQTPENLNTKSHLVKNEDKPSGSHELQDEAVDTDNDREFVMIPCDVKIARLLGWPVDLLPRVSQGYLDRFKVKSNT